jgi:hypothetical protein
MTKTTKICVCLLISAVFVMPISALNSEVKTIESKNSPAVAAALNGGWFKTYGGDGVDAFKGFEITLDGDYIVSGETEVDGSKDAWLIKIDADGDVIWETTYGTTDGWDGLWSVVGTPDGGYLAGGWFYNGTQDNFDALLIKVDENGDIIWTKTYGGAKEDKFFGIQETVDGYVVAGKSASYSSSMFDGYVVKIDFDGNLIWSKIYQKDGYTGELNLITRANDGDGFVIAGGYWASTYPTQGRLLKIDPDGNVLWDKSFGNLISCDYIPAVANAPDDNYIIAGYVGAGTFSLGLWGSDGWLMKADNDGSILWSKQYGIPFVKDSLMYVQPTSDGGFISTGHTLGIGNFGEPYFAAWSKMWLVKTDADGNIEWEKRMPENGHCRTVREIPDGYVLCGYLGEGHADNSEHAILIKTDKNGDIN